MTHFRTLKRKRSWQNRSIGKQKTAAHYDIYANHEVDCIPQQNTATFSHINIAQLNYKE